MFSGIVQAQVSVISAELRGGIRHVRIQKPTRWRLKDGQSISVNGICSTVVRSQGRSFDVEYMSETLMTTTAFGYAPGMVVNLERSLALPDLVDGHLVSGHVDTKGVVVGVAGGELTISAPRETLRLIVRKGSVAVNGVALTVSRTSAKDFTVALIPYTSEHTNLGTLKVGYEVNVEADLIARYIDALTKRGKKR